MLIFAFVFATTLNFKIMNDIQNDSKGEIVMYQPDETIRLEVKLEDDTVWLTQQQMSLLFSVKENTITYHIKEIYRTEELEQEGTARKIRVVRKEGNRIVNRMIDFYNLDMIISVGYKVNSKRGVKFRQWASKVLKDYLIKGYSINKGLQEIRERVDSHDKRIVELEGKVDFFVRSSLPPVEGVFYDGQIFDAYVQIVSLIKQARHSIVLIDNYIDEATLTMLSKREAGVSATIYTRQLSQQQQLDVQRHNQQYPPININVCQHNHDRFLIIDDTVYLFGASLKDAGKKLFAYIEMQETNPTELLGQIH
jgi:hypothetical protein